MSNYQTGNGSHSEGAGSFGQRVDHIGTSAQQLWGEARSAVQDLSGSLDLKGRVQRNPYGTLAAAFGIGYLLGGGLFTPLTGRMVRLGIRLAALPLVKDELLGMAEAALAGFESTARGSGASSSPPAP